MHQRHPSPHLPLSLLTLCPIFIPSSALPPTLRAWQGFTRPKVLLLLPQRNFAFKLIRRLVALAMRETRADSVQGKEKFVEQFTEAEVGSRAHSLN